MSPDRIARTRQVLMLRRSWRTGLPPFRPSVPAPRASDWPTAEAERIVRRVDPAEPWTTGELAAIYPEAGARLRSRGGGRWAR
jgi:hypothetical protein